MGCKGWPFPESCSSCSTSQPSSSLYIITKFNFKAYEATNLIAQGEHPIHSGDPALTQEPIACKTQSRLTPPVLGDATPPGGA